MKKEKGGLDSKKVLWNPDYYTVESDGEMVEMVKGVLEETVYGQPEACFEIARAVTRTLGGLTDPNRPVYVGMFLGEPGVGKTEMGWAAAKIFEPLRPETRLKVIDCNMFQHGHEVSRILGSPPSYVGFGRETMIPKEFLKKPNVIVFDEIEKSDIALHQLLLRIMDKGRLEINDIEDEDDDSLPYLDFSQSIIILTSNIGSDRIRDIKSGRKQLGFGNEDEGSKHRDAKAAGIASVKKFWHHMPEFINRIDSLVVFNSLTEEIQYRLIEKFLDQYYLDQHRSDATYIMATDQLKQWIVSQSDVREAGREIRRKVQRLIITPAAEVKISLPEGVPLIADVSQEEPKRVVFWVNRTMVEVAKKK